MNSMTGYGEGRADNERFRLAVTMRSVNHRFLDVHVRLGEEHRAREAELEGAVRSRLLRGRVEVRATIETVGERSYQVRVQAAAVRALRRELEPLVREGVVEGALRAGDLARLPGLVELQSEPQEWRQQDSDLLAAAAGAALEQLLDARRREGDRLREALDERLTALSELVERLAGRWREIRQGALEALRERLARLLGETAVDEERLVQEAAVLVERSDVREELDRLSTHLAHFREVMGEEGGLGKRLDFLGQEILRELNTVAAKCRDGEMVAWVVHAKLLCEQLREQIQNVE